MPTWTKPVTLTANTNENVADLNAILDDIYARANGGLDETNVPNLAAAFTTYKSIYRASGLSPAAAASATYVIAPSDLFATSGTPGTTRGLFWFDPALHAANARTTKLALRLMVVTNAVAPATNFTVNMNQVTAITGGASTNPGITIGSAITGSGASVNTPGASTVAQAITADFNAPTALQYALTVVVSPGAMAAGSIVQCIAELLVRQV